MEVPYANLKRIYDNSKKELDKAVKDCIDNSWFIKGPKVLQFEKGLAAYRKADAVGVSSGTSALLLAYEALKLKPGDKIVIPSFTFISTPEMATKLGLEIIWVDCNKENYTINTDNLAGILTAIPDIKAVVGVDIFGHTCDWDKVKKIAGDIPVIQDAAQSFGGSYKKQINGSYNDLTCFSFYPAKNMFCFGDGGAVVGKQDYIEHIVMNRDHGRTDKYVHEFLGWNERLDSLQANVLSHMITKIDQHNASRRYVAAIYDQEFENVTALRLPQVQSGSHHSYQSYPCIFQPNQIFNGDIEYLPEKNQVGEGHIVYTSGVDGIISPGIPIGKITIIDSKKFVKFFADFDQIKLACKLGVDAIEIHTGNYANLFEHGNHIEELNQIIKNKICLSGFLLCLH